MLDPSKLPHLQPQQPPETQDDQPEETIWEQIINVFSGKKGVLLAACLSLMIYISVCFQGERLLRSGVYNVLKELGEDGFGISYSAPSSYLAFKSGLNLDDVVITAPEKMGGWVLKTGRITVTSNPFTPRTVEIKANGTHSLITKTIGDIRFIVGKGEITLRLPSKDETLSLDAVFKNIQTASPKSMEGFSIADFSGARRLNNRFHNRFASFVFDNDFQFDLWYEINNVFRSAIQFRMSFLAAVSFDFGNGNSLHVYFLQRFFDFVQLKRFDNGFDFFHSNASARKVH